MENDSNDFFIENFIQAQTQMKSALKDATNPFFKSKYADLASVDRACKQALNENNFAISQSIEFEGEIDFIHTSLLHTSGKKLESKCRIINKTGDSQGFGSSVSYMRRYSLAAICGIVTEDDDAESSTTHAKQWIEQAETKHEFKGTNMNAGINSGPQTRPSPPPAKRSAAPLALSSEEYRMGIPKNRHLGKTLDEMGRKAVWNDFEYWSSRISQEGKPATGEVKRFLDHADAWLKASKPLNLDEPPPFDEDIPL